MLDWNTVALLDEKQLAERTLAVLDGQKSNGGVAGRAGDSWLSARWRCWSGGRVLDWDTVAVLVGRKISGLEHGCVARRETAG